ncbi:putative staphylococcal-like nuclease CAN1 [Dichanthelium oligosanthes]|uniref:Putative staphylococcal-like nuclease CAN1 n=1 Tax=Dichanthelium oligosanthes TaxID=888268 RepID=A0A1E5VYU5_9POAL|nr:putative staphylococcal-like nuclease CAN1 [Dichanthelium oligosanthes]
MSAATGHRRERRGSFHVRSGVAGKRAPPSMVLVYCIGAIALLASAGRTLAPKGQLCLGSFWCIWLTPVACKPQGMLRLHTLPVDAKAVTDGDTITVYVNMANHPGSGNVPPEVRKPTIERTKAKNCQRADAFQKIILNAGQVPNMRGEQVLAKKYRIRLRGIDAPESLMPYGKEAKEELVRLVQGKSLRICIYDSDRYGRLVGDVDCNGVSVQPLYQPKMRKAECLIKHEKTKDGSSTRSLDYLTMEQPAQGISDGMYAYNHRCEGGVDIHDIVVKKSTFRILLYYIGTICLLMTVCRILLKESLGLSSLWSISFAGVIAKWLRCDPVKKESLVIMPTFGVQLEQHFWSKLSLYAVNGLKELTMQNLNPPAKMLVPIWKALCAFVDSNALGASILSQLHDPHNMLNKMEAVCSPDGTLNI